MAGQPRLLAAGLLAALRHWQGAARAAVLALALGLSVLLIYDPDAPPPTFHCTSLRGIEELRIRSLGPGYFCWMGSFASLAGGCALLGRRAGWAGPPGPDPLA